MFDFTDRDQDKWYRVECLTQVGHWEYIADVDTEVEADGVRDDYLQLDPSLVTRSRLMRGQA